MAFSPLAPAAGARGERQNNPGRLLGSQVLRGSRWWRQENSPAGLLPRCVAAFFLPAPPAGQAAEGKKQDAAELERLKREHQLLQQALEQAQAEADRLRGQIELLKKGRRPVQKK